MAKSTFKSLCIPFAILLLIWLFFHIKDTMSQTIVQLTPYFQKEMMNKIKTAKKVQSVVFKMDSKAVFDAFLIAAENGADITIIADPKENRENPMLDELKNKYPNVKYYLFNTDEYRKLHAKFTIMTGPNDTKHCYIGSANWTQSSMVDGIHAKSNMEIELSSRNPAIISQCESAFKKLLAMSTIQ